MDTFIQLTINGFTLGSVYALIALGYSLVYGILKLLNFAHGDVFMVGSFIGFGALQLLGGSTDPKVPTWLLLVLITLAAMAGCARPRRRDRALRLPPASERAEDRAADQRARRLVLPRVLDAAHVRLGAARLRRVLALRRRALLQRLRHRRSARAAAPDRDRRLGIRADDRALAARHAERGWARPCGPPLTTGRPRR